MTAPSVVHFKKSKHDVYVGRPSIWGNPWSHKGGTKADFVVDTRDEAVDNYERWLKGEAFQNVHKARRAAILRRLPELKGKTLGCWCWPRRCHGDVLLKMANEDQASDSALGENPEESRDRTAADGRA